MQPILKFDYHTAFSTTQAFCTAARTLHREDPFCDSTSKGIPARDNDAIMLKRAGDVMDSIRIMMLTQADNIHRIAASFRSAEGGTPEADE